MTRAENVKCRAYRGTACATEVVLKAQGKLCSMRPAASALAAAQPQTPRTGPIRERERLHAQCQPMPLADSTRVESLIGLQHPLLECTELVNQRGSRLPGQAAGLMGYNFSCVSERLHEPEIGSPGHYRRPMRLGTVERQSCGCWSTWPTAPGRADVSKTERDRAGEAPSLWLGCRPASIGRRILQCPSQRRHGAGG